MSRTNDPQGTRRRIVDAAFQAFTTRGYHNTAMHELKAGAGVSGGAFAHHFPTKKALGLAVIRDAVAEAVAGAWIAPVRQAGSAPDGIRAVFDAIADDLDRQGTVSGCPLNNLVLELAGEDSEFRTAMDAVFSDWHRALADAFRADLAAGRARDLEPDTMATVVLALYSGGMALAKSRQDASPLRACVDQLTRILDGHYPPRADPP